MAKELVDEVLKEEEVKEEVTEEVTETAEESDENVSDIEAIVGKDVLEKAEEEKCQQAVNGWLEEHLVDNKKDFEIIDDMATEMCRKDWKIDLSIPGMCTVIYAVTFEKIIEDLKRRQKKHKSFFINVASIFGVGYESDDDDTDSKDAGLRPGGLRPRIIPLDNKVVDIIHDHDIDVFSETKAREWCDVNIHEQNATLEAIATNVVNVIRKEYNYDLGNPVFVWPIFYAFHSRMQEYLHVRRVEDEVSSKELEVLGYYTMRSIIDIKTEQPVIRYEPRQWMKLSLKDDMARKTGDGLAE